MSTVTDVNAWGRGARARIDRRDVPAAVLARVRERDGLGCVACRQLGLTPPLQEPVELDHKQPLSKGGDNHWSNLQFLCRFHNRSRGSRALDPSRLPTWLADLSRGRRLRAHIAWCRATGRVWRPAAPLAEQIDALVRSERS